MTGHKYDILRWLRLRADVHVRTMEDLYRLKTFRRKWGMVVAVYYDKGARARFFYLRYGKHSLNLSDNENWEEIPNTIWIKKTVDRFSLWFPDEMQYQNGVDEEGGYVEWKYLDEEATEWRRIYYTDLEGYTEGTVQLYTRDDVLYWSGLGVGETYLDEVDIPWEGKRIILPDNKIYEYVNKWNEEHEMFELVWEVDFQTDPLRNGLTAIIADSDVGHNKIYTYSAEFDRWLPQAIASIWIRKVVNEFVEWFPEDVPRGYRVIITTDGGFGWETPDYEDEDVDEDIDEDEDEGEGLMSFIGEDELVVNCVYEFDGAFWKRDDQCIPMRNGLTAMVHFSTEGENQPWVYHEEDDEWRPLQSRTIWIRKVVDEFSEWFPMGVDEGHRIILLPPDEDSDFEYDVDDDYSGLIGLDEEIVFNAIYEWRSDYEDPEQLYWKRDGQTIPMRNGLTAIVKDTIEGLNQRWIYDEADDIWRHSMPKTIWIRREVDEIVGTLPASADHGARLIPESGEYANHICEYFYDKWVVDHLTVPLKDGLCCIVKDAAGGENRQHIYFESLGAWVDVGIPRTIWIRKPVDNIVSSLSLVESGLVVGQREIPTDVAGSMKNFIWEWNGGQWVKDEQTEPLRNGLVCMVIHGEGGEAANQPYKYHAAPVDEWLPFGQDGREVEMRYEGGWLQWRYVGDEDWIDLVEIDLDVDIPEGYDFWLLRVEKEDEPDEQITIYDKEELKLKAYGSVRLFLDLLNSRLHIVGAYIDMRFQDGWLEYRFVWDYPDEDDEDGEEDWIPLVEIPISEDGKTPEFREYEGWVQWRYADQTPEDEWTDLFEVPTGIDLDFDCDDGRTPEFRVYEGWFQWKYTDEELWTDLFEIPDIDGELGAGTYITDFDVEVAAGTPPVVDDNDTLRVRITESDATTHDIYLGGHAALKFWHGDHADYDAIAEKDSNTIYYINEPEE